MRYNCRSLVFEYASRYTLRYYENIMFACKDIDFSNYECLDILSLGSGIAPDLMAFEEIFKSKDIFYRGIDDNERWNEFHDFIYDYTDGSNIEVDFAKQSAFKNERAYGDLYNVLVMQFFISSVLSEGWSTRDVHDLFEDLTDSVLRHWYNSKTKTPFVFILNDTDSVFTGRKQFYDLLDILADKGYQGTAVARSTHISDDMNDRSNKGFYGFSFKTSTVTSNNSAMLTIEVTK